MEDEKFVFLSDVREKKHTAASAYKRKTHAGKGGKVRLPSDYMSKKELRAMNGEVKAYKINDPMTWVEFQAMPEDLQTIYVKALRKKFNVPDSRIAKMLGIAQQSFCTKIARLGISGGKGRDSYNWDKEGWARWVNGLPAEAEEAKPDVLEDAIEEVMSEPVEQETCGIEFIQEDEQEKTHIERNIPANNGMNAKILVAKTGVMDFSGEVNEVLATIGLLLGGHSANISVKWEITHD